MPPYSGARRQVTKGVPLSPFAQAWNVDSGQARTIFVFAGQVVRAAVGEISMGSQAQAPAVHRATYPPGPISGAGSLPQALEQSRSVLQALSSGVRVATQRCEALHEAPTGQTRRHEVPSTQRFSAPQIEEAPRTGTVFGPITQCFSKRAHELSLQVLRQTSPSAQRENCVQS